MGYHHNPHLVENNFKKIALTCFISDFICQRNNLGYCDAPYVNKTLYNESLEELQIKEKALELIMENVQNEIQKMKQSGWFQ